MVGHLIPQLGPFQPLAQAAPAKRRMQFLENLEQWCTGKPKTKRQFEEVWNLAPEGYEMLGHCSFR